jgi:hypothetical protein
MAEERQPEGVSFANVKEVVDGLHRAVIASPVTQRRHHAARDVDTEFDVREHALGSRGTQLLRSGQEHDYHGQDQGRYRLGDAQRHGPAPAAGLAAVIQRQRDPPSLAPPDPRDQQHRRGQEREHGGIRKAKAHRVCSCIALDPACGRAEASSASSRSSAAIA